ncbi:MAG: hypothetical protein OXP66_12115 [Candidatus Tectomicrobia bacterium]|nr:hypothetical protein [Candidatus Tectomicrobia bacterium]
MSAFGRVPVADISPDDQPFVVTYRPQMQRLLDSVARMGVLTPLHLRRPTAPAPLQLVTGSKRLRAARQAGHATVPGLVHEAGELTKEQGFLLAVHDNLACRFFNAVEKARVLRRLRVDFQYRDEPLMKEFCPLLDLPPRADVLEAYCALATLDEVLQAATVEHALPVSVALWVGALDTADRQAVLPLFTTLQLGSNRAQECAAHIDEVCQRDDCTAVALFERLGIAALLADPRSSGPQKREAVRQALRQVRYPQLTAHEQRFREAARRLRLPPSVSLRPTPYFENRRYQVSFSFGGKQELRQAAQRLLDAADSEAMDELLDM